MSGVPGWWELPGSPRMTVPGRPNFAFTGQPLDIWYVFIAMGVMSYGDSSQPGSKHNNDQLHFVAERKLRNLWVKRPDVEKHVEERTRY